MTTGFSGADINNAVNLAILNAVRCSKKYELHRPPEGQSLRFLIRLRQDCNGCGPHKNACFLAGQKDDSVPLDRPRPHFPLNPRRHPPAQSNHPAPRRRPGLHRNAPPIRHPKPHQKNHKSPYRRLHGRPRRLRTLLRRRLHHHGLQRRPL